MNVQEETNLNFLQGSNQRPRDSEVPSHPFFQPIEGVDLREFFRKLRRQKWLILGTIVSFMILSLLVLFQVSPRYTAVAHVDISPRQSMFVDFQAVLAGLPADTEMIQTEIQIIRSHNIVKKVIERAELNRTPEFNGVLRPPSRFTTLMDTVGSYLAKVGLDFLSKTPDDDQAPQTVRIEREQTQIINAVLKNLNVEPIGLSRVAINGPQITLLIGPVIPNFDAIVI